MCRQSAEDFQQRTNLVMSILSNPIVKAVATVFAVIVFCKFVAPKIPVVGKYISL